MSDLVLEQIVDSFEVPASRIERMSGAIDIYSKGEDRLYSFDPLPLPPLTFREPMRRDMTPPPPNSISSRPDFHAGSYGNIQREYNLGDMTNEPSLNRYSLTERFDLSGHNNSGPHLNQTVNDMLQKNRFDEPRDIITGGISGKSYDGYKGLGPAHRIDLDDLQK